MSSRVKKLVVALVVVVLLVAAYIIVKNIAGKEADVTETENEPFAICTVDAKDIRNVRYTKDDIDISFKCDNGFWSYEYDDEFPVTQNILSEIADSVSTISATRKLNTTESLATYGLDKPQLTVTISTFADTYTISVGDYTSYTDEYYALFEGDVYLMDSNLIETFSKDLFEYLTPSTLESFDDIVSFNIDGVEYSEKTKVASLETIYSNVEQGSIVDYKNKQEYGFDGTEHTVDITYNVKTDVTDDAGSKTSTIMNTLTYSFCYAYSNDQSYIMLQDDDLIYYVSGVEQFDTVG